jgi:hypothetical protein
MADLCVFQNRHEKDSFAFPGIPSTSGICQSPQIVAGWKYGLRTIVQRMA